PLARLDRRLRDPGPGVQGPADGRSDGQPAHHRAEPDRARGGHGQRPAAGQGCGTGTGRRPAAGAHRGEDPAGEGWGGEVSSTLDVHTPDGQTAGTVELPAELFNAHANLALMHQVVVAQLAAARQGTHSTKTRGEVRGGGVKPYRQKGTGRARQGSI